MEITLIKNHPKNISQDYLNQLSSMVAAGGQVNAYDAKIGIRNASLVAILVAEGHVIAGCCLKNPFDSYRKRTFIDASATEKAETYPYELGYIVTHPKFEGKGHCSRLLDLVFPVISTSNIYATTRKAAMAHILGKHDFYKNGQTYKKDLQLLLYNGKTKPSNDQTPTPPDL